MSDIAIRIENLGKRYRYGGAAPLSANLRADVTDWVRGLLRKPDYRLQTTDIRPENITDKSIAQSPESNAPSGVTRHASLHEIHERHLDADPNYFWALKDINLEIKQGEVVGIIGRNGAGKSTLLKILSRITPPTTGKITYRGRMASLLEVGTGFHRELTGRENIYLNGSILGMKRAEITKQFDEIVAFAEVEKFIDTPVKFYSSGMYVRLAFAVAAHLEPEILVVDEVLAVGDAQFQKKCLGKMGDVAKQGRTVLFVSHNMGAIQSLTLRAVLLEKGCVVSDGPPLAVIQAYLSSGGVLRETEVEGVPRSTPEYGVKVRITRIVPLIEEAGGFCFGGPVRFRITVKSSIVESNLRFGVTICDACGTPVLSAFSRPELSLEEGQHDWLLTLYATHLAPGSYLIALSVGQGHVTSGCREYDVVRPGPSFSVVGLSMVTDGVANWSNTWGSIVHPLSQVSIIHE
jgi:lipopolysaccharide transport system ATP-binding protein